jgi:hypothetical protein
MTYCQDESKAVIPEINSFRPMIGATRLDVVEAADYSGAQ